MLSFQLDHEWTFSRDWEWSYKLNPCTNNFLKQIGSKDNNFTLFASYYTFRVVSLSIRIKNISISFWNKTRETFSLFSLFALITFDSLRSETVGHPFAAAQAHVGAVALRKEKSEDSRTQSCLHPPPEHLHREISYKIGIFTSCFPYFLTRLEKLLWCMGALRNVDRYMGAPMKCLTNHGCSFEISIDKWVLLWNVYQIHWCSFLNVYTSIHRKSKPQNIYSLYVMYTHGGCMYVWDPWGLYYRVAHFFADSEFWHDIE